jgi:hypothetical protein
MDERFESRSKKYCVVIDIERDEYYIGHTNGRRDPRIVFTADTEEKCREWIHAERSILDANKLFNSQQIVKAALIFVEKYEAGNDVGDCLGNIAYELQDVVRSVYPKPTEEDV